jgi:hypothetical protein
MAASEIDSGLSSTQTMQPTKPPSKKLDLQDRDFRLLRGLFESRVMTTAHVAVLYFDSKREAAKKRLQKLKEANLIDERPRRRYERSVLFLARKGYDILRERGVLNEYPYIGRSSLERRSRVSDLTLRHELEVMDVKSAFHFAIKKTGTFTIPTFNTWPLLDQFEVFHPGRSKPEIVRPDGLILIHEPEPNAKGYVHTFFVEVDRSNEIQDKLVGKASCYFEYYKSGGFAVRNRARRDDYKKFPFRVLMVFKTAERRNNTAERLLQNTQPILTMIWLATFADVTADPLGTIWIRPTDYRDAVKGTSFDTDYTHRKFGYRRQAERETLVEAKIRKMRLLEDR